MPLVDVLSPLPRFASSISELPLHSVLDGVPFVISASDGREDWDMSEFLERCSDVRLDTLSTPDKAGIAFLQDTLIQYLLLVSSVDVNAVAIARTNISLSKFAAPHAERVGGGFLESVLGALAKYSFHAASALSLAKVLMGPPYLKDLGVSLVCPLLWDTLTKHPDIARELELKDRIFRPQVLRSALAEFETIGFGAYFSQGTLGLSNKVRHELVTELNSDRPHSDHNVFWGGVNTTAYPMHFDMDDGDVVMHVLRGCKELVVFLRDHDGPADSYLQRSILKNIFNLDAFSHLVSKEDGDPSSVLIGWHGYLRAGDVMFLPGDSIHQIRNVRENTFAISQRVWSSTIVRNMGFFARSKGIEPETGQMSTA